MGAGALAERESTLAVRLLEQFLRAGVRPENALRTLNSALALRNDEAAGGFGSVFRDRLTYLMNGNNVYGKPVNTQELADEIDISRPAVRKYLKPNDRREVTVPSALVVSRIARYFRTTPNFLLGFDEVADDADAQRAGESDVYSSLGLSQEAIDGLHRLHAQAVTDPKAADLQRLLDKLICSYAHEADKLL